MVNLNELQPDLSHTICEPVTIIICPDNGTCFMQLSDNGYVTMKAPLRSNLPRSFPISSGAYTSRISRMIAVYWSDIDTRCGGDIWYRQVSLKPEDELSKNISLDIAKSEKEPHFTPKSAIIVTWERVTSQNQYPCNDQRVSQLQTLIS